MKNVTNQIKSKVFLCDGQLLKKNVLEDY